jgi:hypothetical protein
MTLVELGIHMCVILNLFPHVFWGLSSLKWGRGVVISSELGELGGVLFEHVSEAKE